MNLLTNHLKAQSIAPAHAEMAIAMLAMLAFGIGCFALLTHLLRRRYGHDNAIALDALTGFPNRAAFETEVGQRARNCRPGRSFAVIAMEIADIDAINHQFGSHIGDRVVAAIAQRIRAANVPGVFLARTGGAQFCSVGLVRDSDETFARAQTLRPALIGSLTVEGHELSIDVRLGGATYPIDACKPETLMGKAQAALARAMADPLGSIAIHDEAADALAHRRLTLANDLRGALERGEFRLFYQPQVWIKNGRIIGYEALLRWQHPLFGMVSPAEFIPLAEQSGRIIVIGDWALRKACEEAVCWPDHLRVAVNLSPLQLRQPGLAEKIGQALAKSGLKPDRLEIELTESLLIEDRAHALKIFARIKALGVRLALDDFGTGYSSMAVLREFPFDKLKLDKSFIDDIDSSKAARAILHAMLALGRKLGMPILVEGVETARQLEILRSEGCNKVQGYFTGRPAATIVPEELPALVA